MKALYVCGVTACALATFLRIGSAQDAPPAATPVQDIAGNGGWKPDQQSPAATQPWTLQVTRAADNSITGRVAIAGSPLLTSGNVQGQIVGENVSGTITDDAGTIVARFDGTINASGMWGTYTDYTGEVGAWEGAAPQ